MAVAATKDSEMVSSMFLYGKILKNTPLSFFKLNLSSSVL